MSVDESRILQGRAEAFLRHARDALEHGEFDFACFSSEQAAQLYLKSVMLELVGEVPRLHRTRDLLHLLGRSAVEAEKSIFEFTEKNRERLRLLDYAYIASRYLPSMFTREEAETLVKLAEEITRLADRVLEGCRR